MPIRWKRIWLFFAFAFGGTYGLVAFYLWGLKLTFEDPAWLKLSLVGMLPPALSALALQRFVYREPVRETLALRWGNRRWWIAAWVLGPVLCVVTFAVSLLLPWNSYDPSMTGVLRHALATPEQHGQLMSLSSSSSVHPLLWLLLPSLVLAPTVGMFNASGEEIGWRGFLFRETVALGFWRQCAVVAFFWWLWHAPLVFMGYGNYPDPVLGSAALFGTIFLWTPMMNYVRLRSGSSLAAALLHSSGASGTMIATAGVVGGTPLSIGWGSFTCCAVLALSIVALAIYDRRWSEEPVMFAPGPAPSPAVASTSSG